MGKRLNWEYRNIKENIDHTEENRYDWREIKAFNDIKCDACQRRIKKGQKMLWNVNTKNKMHLAHECKLW
jgi:hypothetical protein